MKKKTRAKPKARLVPKQRAGQNRPGEKLRQWREGLFQPVDALPLGIFRFLFGLLLALEFLVVSRGSFPADYIKPQFHFTYPLFDVLGLKPLPESYLWVIFRVLQVSTVGIMLGFITRLSLIVFTAAFGYFFFMESSVYTNHYYLIFLLSFLMSFGHAGSIFSLDRLINKNARRDQVAYWELFLLRFQVCIVFFFGALAKLNADWLIYAAPLYLNLIKHFALLGYPLHDKWMAVVLSWGGMLSDLGLGILLFLRRYPRLTFIWLCLFNGMNIVLFGLGINTFPYLMISTYILFLPSPMVREFMARIFGERLFARARELG